MRETDSVNIARDGLRVDILRVAACQSGLCIDTLVPNAPFTLGVVQPDPLDVGQIFELNGYYQLPDAANALELRMRGAATNVLGLTAHAAQPWAVDAVAPWIQPVSPAAQAILPLDLPVTISATFGDGELMAAIAGGRSGAAYASQERTGARRQGHRCTGIRNSAESRLGAWSMQYPAVSMKPRATAASIPPAWICGWRWQAAKRVT